MVFFPPFSGFPRRRSAPPRAPPEKGEKRPILADFLEGRADTLAAPICYIPICGSPSGRSQKQMSAKERKGAQKTSQTQAHKRASDREIHAPPPQNRRSTSWVQNWGWCVFCLFLRFRQFAHHPPPPKRPPDEECLLWGWCVVGGPLRAQKGTKERFRVKIAKNQVWWTNQVLELSGKSKVLVFFWFWSFNIILPTFCPPTIWAISLEFHRKLSISGGRRFLRSML